MTMMMRRERRRVAKTSLKMKNMKENNKTLMNMIWQQKQTRYMLNLCKLTSFRKLLMAT